MKQLSSEFKELMILGDKMIPEALKELHAKLDHIRKIIHAGGVPPHDTATTLLAQTGQKVISYAEEARLIETGAAKKIVRAGKYQQNLANADPNLVGSIKEVYKHEAGFPDLMKYTVADKATGVTYYPGIAAASGPIKNEILHGETLFRAFGPGGMTHGTEVGTSNAIGAFWGRGKPPKNAAEWRRLCAVLDEWNRNGWLSMVHIPENVKIPACTSVVSEQFSKKIAGQYLPGGAKQAVVEAFFEKQVKDITNQLYLKGGGKATLPNGVVIEVRQSGWKGINGKIGYGKTAIPGAGVVERLGVTERQSKAVTQVAQAAVKLENSN
ncbi:hypothetical protein [Massilia glaciei]|uniref:hypothetical protein n=1 Tax=Massilia glaciei TaxID=1524097 RepID=UPI0011B1D5D9|nr:hypothetical protein [Massilia glaciei]